MFITYDCKLSAAQERYNDPRVQVWTAKEFYNCFGYINRRLTFDQVFMVPGTVDVMED